MYIINIHGFMGEADNRNRKSLAQLGYGECMYSPQLDYLETSPSQILALFEKKIEEKSGQDILLVGQSLGGWVAEVLSLRHGFKCLLTNPCLDPECQNVVLESEKAKKFMDEYRALKPTGQNPNAVILCSRHDEVLGENLPKCQTVTGRIIMVDGGHSDIENRTEEIKKALKILL